MFPELEVDKIILEKNTKNMEINEELGGRNLKKEFKLPPHFLYPTYELVEDTKNEKTAEPAEGEKEEKKWNPI